MVQPNSEPCLIDNKPIIEDVQSSTNESLVKIEEQQVFHPKLLLNPTEKVLFTLGAETDEDSEEESDEDNNFNHLIADVRIKSEEKITEFSEQRHHNERQASNELIIKNESFSGLK